MRSGQAAQVPASRLPASPVLHENQLTHTDLKPENILFVNSEFETLYNEHKVGVGRGKAALWGSPGWTAEPPPSLPLRAARRRR